MRTLHTDKIIEAVKEMCISANLYLADDMDGKIRQAAKEEDSTLGKKILNQLHENLKIAGEDKIPICQDTGMAVFFVKLDRMSHFEGMRLRGCHQRRCESGIYGRLFAKIRRKRSSDQ